jgi:hypothetical protein
MCDGGGGEETNVRGRESKTPIREEHRSRKEKESGETKERTLQSTRRRRRRDRTDDSLWCMVVTLLTSHEDRSWSKARVSPNTRRRRGGDQCERKRGGHQ